MNICLINLVVDDQLAVAVSLKHATHNAIVPDWAIHCFEDTKHFHTYPVSILSSLNHPSQKRVDEIILWALEGGIIHKFTLDSRINFNRQIPLHVVPVALSVEHIFIAWVFYSIFASFAFGAFITEHIVHRMVLKPSPGFLWKIANRLIDDNRQFWLPPIIIYRQTQLRLRSTETRCEVNIENTLQQDEHEFLQIPEGDLDD